MRAHELKTWPGPFQALADGRKRFEWRRNDRCFEVGDTLILREYDPARLSIWSHHDIGYTGREVHARVTYVLAGILDVPHGFCVMSLDLLTPAVAVPR